MPAWRSRSAVISDVLVRSAKDDEERGSHSRARASSGTTARARRCQHWRGARFVASIFEPDNCPSLTTSRNAVCQVGRSHRRATVLHRSRCLRPRRFGWIGNPLPALCRILFLRIPSALAVISDVARTPSEPRLNLHQKVTLEKLSNFERVTVEFDNRVDSTFSRLWVINSAPKLSRFRLREERTSLDLDAHLRNSSDHKALRKHRKNRLTRIVWNEADS
jgi:hypothetical protein